MKKTLLSAMAFLALSNGMVNAQIVKDSVITGASYANQIYYSLANDEVKVSPKTNWHIAFGTGVGQQGVGLRFNSLLGKLYLHPTADVDDFENVDLTGLDLATATPLINSEIDWFNGAFNQSGVSSDPFDYSWGGYNMGTHNVDAKRVFVAKIGADTYKFKFELSSVAKKYTIHYGIIGVPGVTSTVVDLAPHAAKNYIYFNLATDALVDNEPATTAWDLVFGVYTTQLSPTMTYEVAGVLHNDGLEVVRVYAPDAANYTFAGTQVETFSPDINTIGWNTWKKAGQGGTVVFDTTVFFVKDFTDKIWKLKFTGFVGGSDPSNQAGKYVFTKEMVVDALSVDAIENKLFVSIFPNPANNVANVVIDNANTSTIAVYSTVGTLVSTTDVTASGLQSVAISTENLSNGIYQVVVTSNGQATTQKLMIQR